MRFCPECGERTEETACPADGAPTVLEHLVRPDAGVPDIAGRSFGGRYVVEALIGQGGMGWVFRARQAGMQRTVALKVMRPVGDESAVKRFYREARAGAMLRHHHSVTIHDFGVSEDGYPYLVMELLDGRSLGQVIREEGPLHPFRAVSVAWQVCKALDEAHGHGLVHRDLKPSNVFLTRVHGESDYVKLLDLGIARFVGGDGKSTTITETGAVIGTPMYLSPEQAQGRPVDRRADLYSLGVVLYQMLVGAAPFDSPSPAGLLVKHIQEPPPPLPDNTGGHEIPHALRDLTARLLCKDPAGRPGSAAEVAASLAAIAALVRAPGAGPVDPREDTGITMTMPPAALSPGVPSRGVLSPGVDGAPESAGEGAWPGPAESRVAGARPPRRPGRLIFLGTASLAVATAVVLLADVVPDTRVVLVPAELPAIPPDLRPAPQTGEPVPIAAPVPAESVAAGGGHPPASRGDPPPPPERQAPERRAPEVEARPAPTPERPGRPARASRRPERLAAKNAGLGPFRNVANFCWEHNPKALPEKKAHSFVVRVTLTPQGFPHHSLLPVDLRGTNFNACIQERAQQIRFDVPPDGGPVAFRVKVSR